MRTRTRIAIAAVTATCATAGVLLTYGQSSADPVVTDAAIAPDEAERLLASFADSAPAGQRPALKRGVTFEEYGDALVAGRDCTIAKLDDLPAMPGVRFTVETSDVSWSKDRFRGSYVVGFRWADASGVTPEVRARLADVQRECADAHVRWVEAAYQVGFLAGPRLESASDSFRECVEDGGLELSGADPRTAVATLLDELDAKEMPGALEGCLAEHPSVLTDPRTQEAGDRG